jgi:hypothetical protein
MYRYAGGPKVDRAAARPGALCSLLFDLYRGPLFWVVATILAYDLRHDTFDVGKGLC